MPFWSDKPNKRMWVSANMLMQVSVVGRNRDVACIDRRSMIWTDFHIIIRFYTWKTKHIEQSSLSHPMRINKLPPHLSHIFTDSAVRNYMDAHRDDYERLQPRGIWLHYNGSTQVGHTTFVQDTR